MASRIQAIDVHSLLNTTGAAVGGLGCLTLHGWDFTETSNNAGIIEFRTHINALNHEGAPTVPVIGDNILMTRAVAADSNDSPWFSERGIWLPGGLFLDLKTGSATFVGSVFIS